MPDKWEYPWFAGWDLAFHCIALAHVDPTFAKRQLLLLCHEWYMRPDGQIPAYEWDFGDLNPPVQAFAAMRVFVVDAMTRGTADWDWLTAMFNKLVINYTWWMNRQDPDGRDVFGGGFLGLDNISPFDRSRPPDLGGTLDRGGRHRLDGDVLPGPARRWPWCSPSTTRGSRTSRSSSSNISGGSASR